ncbi:PAS domain-containing sensor histidine kinase [Nonlabens sp. Ci31]|jgi:signal transduction histidine kinase|uniref:sensor histidine kinase n=1 Tax=Nonlabens sp. Ci31 TaxID=2608253 RepID=UPI0014640DDD|nr:PAS domain-containing sensor histidine kinase [Nonlabens sp. Ci31]QJP34069.1 PAS domain-containing sensor histidine kinase [Nonlabens sp. Ci31]
MKIPPKKSLQQKLQDKEYFLKETALMTQTGSYSGNFKTGFCFMDEIGRKVLNIPNDFQLNFESALTLFVDYKQTVKKFKNSLEGFSFEQDVEMIDYDGKKFWVRATGKPLVDDYTGAIVGIRGVFTSIDRFIKQGKELEKRAELIDIQNERLIHFAHIVSHNLRSHSSNLELTLETFAAKNSDSEETVFKSYLKDISTSLSQTLEHLNEVVTINTHERGRELVDIKDVFESVLEEHRPLLGLIDLRLDYDFTALTHLNYVPSFLRSILTNLLSNSIKYRDVLRPLHIDVKSKCKGSKELLVFKDNGIGIDLQKNRDKIFNMYRTFHDNDDARGVGLFLTKNQVESLGGDISVKSILGVGSSFTVKF